jgi:hypothetical protein
LDRIPGTGSEAYQGDKIVAPLVRQLPIKGFFALLVLILGLAIRSIPSSTLAFQRRMAA